MNVTESILEKAWQYRAVAECAHYVPADSRD